MASIGMIKAGVVGCGRISPAYLVAPGRYGNLSVVGCADLDLGRARHRAETFGVPRSCTVDELLGMDGLDVVVNLTPPSQHFDVSMAAIAAGKSIYAEKPLATTRGQGREILLAAQESGVRVGCSPDTFLSPAMQACRALIDQQAIGEVIGAVAFFASSGPELVHPEPDFLYQPGAGPLLDMGPYYLTTLIALLGPISKVSGAASATLGERIVFSGPRRGDRINVDTPTHVAATLEFESGVIGNLLTSFDVWASNLPRIEIYGTKGSLSLPDPDGYVGQVRLRQAGWPDWRDVPVSDYRADRAIGLADLAQGLRTGRPHRADGTLAYHVLDASLAVLESCRDGKHIDVTSTCDRPAPVPSAGLLDDDGSPW